MSTIRNNKHSVCFWSSGWACMMSSCSPQTQTKFWSVQIKVVGIHAIRKVHRRSTPPPSEKVFRYAVFVEDHYNVCLICNGLNCLLSQQGVDGCSFYATCFRDDRWSDVLGSAIKTQTACNGRLWPPVYLCGHFPRSYWQVKDSRTAEFLVNRCRILSHCLGFPFFFSLTGRKNSKTYRTVHRIMKTTTTTTNKRSTATTTEEEEEEM